MLQQKSLDLTCFEAVYIGHSCAFYVVSVPLERRYLCHGFVNLIAKTLVYLI